MPLGEPPIHQRSLQLLAILIALALLGTTFWTPTTSAQDHQREHQCYGFLIPLPAGLDTTQETFENSRVRTLINDLLREDSVVYWLSENITIHTQAMHEHNASQERSFLKGAFLIPFSGNQTQDALLTSILYDYNTTSEIDTNSMSVECYQVLEARELTAHTLLEPKIVQYLGTATRWGWPCYLQIADAGGFLTMEFLLEHELSTSLNNDKFNVLMWPYHPTPRSTWEVLKSITNVDDANTIRTFVNEGGGFIGSCYGALAASSGIFRPVPFISLRYAHNPTLLYRRPMVGFSLSDTIMDQTVLVTSDLYITQTHLSNTSHPLAYGLKSNLTEFFSGPWFRFIGKNSQIVATFEGFTGVRRTLDLPLFYRPVLSTPAWIDSTFGEGKVILFASHPEFVNNISVLFDQISWEGGDEYYGRRSIFNALFYGTADGREQASMSTSYPISFLETIAEQTAQLELAPPTDVFSDIKQRLASLSANLSHLQAVTSELYRHCSDSFLLELFETKSKVINYTSHYCIMYHDYVSRALATLDLIEQVLPLLQDQEIPYEEELDSLQEDLLIRLTQAEPLVFSGYLAASRLQDLLENPRLTLLNKFKLMKLSKQMLVDFEVGLKYVPQLCFESLKFLRHCWYEYEAVTALQVLSQG